MSYKKALHKKQLQNNVFIIVLLRAVNLNKPWDTLEFSFFIAKSCIVSLPSQICVKSCLHKPVCGKPYLKT